MNFDLRKPLGGMFTLLGAILAVYGVLADPAIYERCFGLNVNLIWGAVMLVFGGTMLWLGRRRQAPEREPTSVGAPREHLT
jgi:hypothetical protein